jgi:hypothetical protein
VPHRGAGRAARADLPADRHHGRPGAVAAGQYRNSVPLLTVVAGLPASLVSVSPTRPNAT